MSNMNVSTLDRTQTQYERKLARQKQLDMMEAAAAGQAYADHSSSPSDSDSINSRSSKSHAPEGAIESARRFLWDEEEEAAAANAANHGGGRVMAAASAYDMYSDSTSQGVNLMGQPIIAPPPTSSTTRGFGSRMANTIMGTFRRSHNDEPVRNVNLAPRRQSNVFDAQSREADEHMEYKGRRKGILSGIADCCMAMFHVLVGALAIMCEVMTACLAKMNPKLCALVFGALSGIGLFIFSIVAIVHRSKGGGGGSNNAAANLPDIIDELRYTSLRNVIIDSAFTSKNTLDTAGTAQNYALRWLTDEDPATLAIDDDALLQRYALATFYFSTYVYAEIVDTQQNGGGSEGGWTYGDYWMSEKGICMWFGVSCPAHLKEGEEEVHYNENSNVMRLNLTENNIRGVIPSELTALEDLVSLDLSNNMLQGTVPKGVGGFRELRELYLEDNLLTGTLHTEYGQIASLRDFFIGTNKFTGTIPNEIGNLQELRALGMDENLLTGQIPNLWECKNILILYLDSNQLTGTISPNIKNLSELIDLRLRKNSLTGIIPEEINELTHMELFYVDDNKLGGKLPANWGLMTRLQEIQVYKNELTGVLPESISSLKDLKVFYVDNNKFVGTVPVSYGSLADLQTLYIFNNELTGTIPTEVGQLVDLIDFQLYNNAFTGRLPSELGKCYKLKKLEAQDNKFTGVVPADIGAIEQLQILKLYRNELTGSMPKEICNARTNFMLDFIGADCNTDDSGTLACACCTACYP